MLFCRGSSLCKKRAVRKRPLFFMIDRNISFRNILFRVTGVFPVVPDCLYIIIILEEFEHF